MELHDALAALARDHGEALFSDAGAFRGALDDYLDEGTASTGTINLLTDAVRLGALDGLLSMLDSGATSDSAVDTAGRRLARDRGSADVTGSQWAVAVLGYALGRVPEDMATRLRPDARTADAGPSAPPAGPPVVSGGGGGAVPGWPSSGGTPPHPPSGSQGAPGQHGPAGQHGGSVPAPPTTFSSPQPAPGQGAASYQWSGGGPGQGGGQPQSWGQPPQKKSKTGLIVGGVAAAVVLLVAVVIGIVALAGGDDDEDPSADPTSETSDSADVSGGNSPGSAQPPTTSAPTTATTATSIGGPVVVGDGYSYSAPEGWTDGTIELKQQDTIGTIDTGVLWGDTLNTSRASVLVETSSSYGESDPNELKDTWIDTVIGGITPVTADGTAPTPTDLEPMQIGGLDAVGIELLWENQNNAQVRQLAFLVISGDQVFSITASFTQADEGVEPVVYDILGSWVWQ